MRVASGRIQLQTAHALGSSSGVTVAAGAALELQGGSTFGNSTAAGTISLSLAGAGLVGNAAGALDSVGGANAYTGAITIASGGAEIDSSSPGDTLSLTGGINTSGNLLTVGGPGDVLISTKPISGSGGVAYSGSGTLTLAGGNTYSGNTIVNSGALQTSASAALGSSALQVNADAADSAVSITGAETVAGLSGTQSGNGGLANLTVEAGGSLTVDQAGDTSYAGSLTLNGPVDTHPAAKLAKSGPGSLAIEGPVSVAGGSSVTTTAGTLEFDGDAVLADSSSLMVNGGTLKLNVTSAQVGMGVTANVADGATLELAGPVAALTDGTIPLQRVTVENSGSIHVDAGAVQQIGGVDGDGLVQVDSGASLTADYITGAALTIGGDPTTPALVTIDASDAAGNPTAAAGFALAGSLVSGVSSVGDAGASGGILAAGDASESLSANANEGAAGAVISGGNATAVPEPTSRLMSVFGVLICLLYVMARWAVRGPALAPAVAGRRSSAARSPGD